MKKAETDTLKQFDKITGEQFAMLMGVTMKTLKNRAPELPPFKKVGRRWLFDGEDVRAFLRPTR